MLLAKDKVKYLRSVLRPRRRRVKGVVIGGIRTVLKHSELKSYGE